MTRHSISVRLLALAMACTSACALNAQTFKSGSNETDGDLDFSKIPGGPNYTFDPQKFSPPLDQDHDNVFNFKTINIPPGATVTVSAQQVNGPMTWLATGNVNINGTLILGGANGLANNSLEQRSPAVPGPGGFYGGVGGNNTVAPTAGGGPNGSGGAAGSKSSNQGKAGGFIGNSFLVPLVGGSGGGGGFWDTTNPNIGGGGGAGGGAILIASDGTITIGGTISANGGSAANTCQSGGAGAGGAVRLAANSITGGGRLLVAAGSQASCSNSGAGNGIIRLEAFQLNFTGTTAGAVYTGSPYATFVTGVPMLKVVSVAGVTVNPYPTGSFAVPDVAINSANPVPIVVQGTNIPAGTTVQMQFYSENGPNLTASATLDQTLQGTTTVTFPPGYSQGLVSASFTVQSQAPKR
ncbi:MAG: hypothetical protein C5B51_32355 [Terriglobia bacterium]|nr:MAG: hypothetical protein C5B51_32355 [Terriglobia bacterium]